MCLTSFSASRDGSLKDVDRGDGITGLAGTPHRPGPGWPNQSYNASEIAAQAASQLLLVASESWVYGTTDPETRAGS